MVREALLRASRMDRATRAAMIYDAVRNTTAYLVRFYHVARRMGAIDPEASVPLASVERMAEGMRGSPVDIETVRELVHEKLDLEALNDFLDGLRGVRLVEPPRPSPLAREVLGNPYLRADRASSAKLIGVDALIQAKRRSLASRRARLFCTHCRRTHEVTIGSVPEGRAYRCPSCGSLTLAPLPPGERGDAMVQAYLKKLRRERLTREEERLARELREREEIYANYAASGYSRQVLEAFAALGVGPRKARKLLSDLQVLGEDEFYKGLIRAEEEYAAYKRFWKK